jgi:hypothetical protein
LFLIISIPSNFCYFRPSDHVISMECSALNFWCQCTQQKLQTIYSFQSVPLWPQKDDVFHFSKFNVSLNSVNTSFPLSLTLNHKVCYVHFPYTCSVFTMILDNIFNQTAYVESTWNENHIQFWGPYICGCQHHQRKTICLYVLLLLDNTVVSNHVNSDHV